MNYGELKEQIRDMGFSDDAEIEDFADIVPNCINRAIEEINLNVEPIIGTCIIEQTGGDDGLVYYDIEALAEEQGDVFLDFADVPVFVGDTIYRRFNDFEIEDGKILIMSGSEAGKFKVFYKKRHTQITASTEETIEIELKQKTHHLLPYLVAYYIWLEDELTKATYYYNRYEALLQSYEMEKSKPRARILSGGI